MTPEELRDHLRLARTDGVGPVTYRRLLRRFAAAADAIAALPGLARAGGRTTPLRIRGAGEAERELELLDRLGGRFVVLGEPDYPSMLALMDVAPPVLAVLATLPC